MTEIVSNTINDHHQRSDESLCICGNKWWNNKCNFHSEKEYVLMIFVFNFSSAMVNNMVVWEQSKEFKCIMMNISIAAGLNSFRCTFHLTFYSHKLFVIREVGRERERWRKVSLKFNQANIIFKIFYLICKSCMYNAQCWNILWCLYCTLVCFGFLCFGLVWLGFFFSALPPILPLYLQLSTRLTP